MEAQVRRAGVPRKAPVECCGGPRGEHSDSIALLLGRLGRRVSRGLRDAMDHLGLDPAQFSLLEAVAAVPGTSQQAVSCRLHIPPSRIVSMLDELEARRLIERYPNPVDRRAHDLRLTEAGEKALAEATAVARDFEARLLSSLTGRERAELLKQLQALCESKDPARSSR